MVCYTVPPSALSSLLRSVALHIRAETGRKLRTQLESADAGLDSCSERFIQLSESHRRSWVAFYGVDQSALPITHEIWMEVVLVCMVFL